ETQMDFRPSGHAFRPQGPGLIYRVVMGGSTFSLRGIACDNIKEVADEIMEGDRELQKALKIEDEDYELHHFRCDFVEQGEIIMDQLFNRRFPLYEDMLCNLSDPGYSWWMEPTTDSLVIHFKSHSIEREKNLIKLGPIGDYALAHRRFSELGKVLRKLFPVREFNCDERRLIIKPVEASDKNFKALYELFSRGAAPTSFSNSGPEQFGGTLCFYLGESACVRGFSCALEPRQQANSHLA